MNSRDIQRLLDNPDNLGRVDIPHGEYEGKFAVNKSCRVNGNGSLFWSNSGPVVVVGAEKVELNDLKIELTSGNLSPEQAVSAYCRYPDTQFSDVQVNGAILGIEDEEQFWGVPKIINIGMFTAEKEHVYTMEIYSPVEAEISCNFHDVTLSADILLAGYNTITVSIGKIKSGSELYGNIVIKSAVERRLILCGTAGDYDSHPDGTCLFTVSREAPMKYADMLKSLDPVMLASMPEPEPEKVEIKTEKIDEEPEQNNRLENVLIESGKSIPVASRKYRIELEGESMLKMDIDGYVFMLDSRGLVNSDRRMIFFGNDHSDCGSVSYLNAPDKRIIYIDFRHIPEDVNKLVVLFSIYGNNPNHLFDRLKNGKISVLCENGVNMNLPLDRFIHYRTVLAMEFVRTDGIWEMIPSGKGVGMALDGICRSYGVLVTN